MFLRSLATALPPASFTAADCWSAVERSNLRERVRPLSLRLIRRILHTDSGIDRRHFSIDDPARLLAFGPDELNLLFRDTAPALAGRALAAALERAGTAPHDLDALFICTCTGYLCPGVTSYVAEQLGLRADAVLHDVVGLGCGAAIPTLRAAASHLALHPGHRVATVAVEVCSAAFHLDDDPGVIVSALLFGDGAAAAVWTSDAPPGTPRAHGFQSVHRPEHRDRIRFETRGGRLRNLLDLDLAPTVGATVRDLHDRMDAARAVAIVPHGGGRDVLDALERALPGRTFPEARAVLRACGNMSSPSVLFALERHLAAPQPPGPRWLVAFGAGFSCHAAWLEVA